VAKNWKDPAEAAELLRASRDALAGTTGWEAEQLEASLRGVAESRGVSAGKIFQPLRVALTGLPVSPGIFEMLLQMGRELSLRRIDKGLAVLAGR
jgi:glutamyl-tRNA synthetase